MERPKFSRHGTYNKFIFRRLLIEAGKCEILDRVNPSLKRRLSSGSIRIQQDLYGLCSSYSTSGHIQIGTNALGIFPPSTYTQEPKPLTSSSVESVPSAKDAISRPETAYFIFHNIKFKMKSQSIKSDNQKGEANKRTQRTVFVFTNTRSEVEGDKNRGIADSCSSTLVNAVSACGSAKETKRRR